ncbi:MAG: CpaF family protein [Pseudobdellovibrio sp.]
MNLETKKLFEQLNSQNQSLQHFVWPSHLKNVDISVQNRILNEFNGHGPLEELLQNDEVSEILVNNFNRIFYEKRGQLFTHPDHFYSPKSYLSYVDRLAQKCGRQLNREKPVLEVQIESSRFTLVYSEISDGAPILSIRKLNHSIISFDHLEKEGWAPPAVISEIKKMVLNKKNILIVGGTSSGKTTAMKCLLNLVGETERVILIEDTRELALPNAASVSLLTREDLSEQIKKITLDFLIKKSLRLRPDRLVIGEIRGAEACSLLQALSTGHSGSLCTLHALNSKQALLRLEMLVQMGAPQWDLRAIRRLIALTLDYVIVVEKKSAERRLKEIHQLKSVEESGITLQQIF